ncbi:hypothetical protein PCANC_00333 [Puccinia coronata f. sp. avenae]|uniref:Uncharacterized protein n=1 Tax=Puccinia coronata f. sp. avenae TaxID=200324 RepID=A0A2N5W9M1_9BASI|nr:hypothetical protein PCANC_00333 [Puccinia coronata f. sp. avenae]
MHRTEVLAKLPVARNFLFGTLLLFPKIMLATYVNVFKAARQPFKNCGLLSDEQLSYIQRNIWMTAYRSSQAGLN